MKFDLSNKSNKDIKIALLKTENATGSHERIKKNSENV